MKRNPIPNGVWPTMVTPYNDDGTVDYNALEHMIEWYIDRGVAGFFAVCGSSEMFNLTREESVAISEFFVKQVNGRVGVVASGHVSLDMKEQIAEVNAIAAAGVDAVILISNRIAAKDEDDDVFIANMKTLMAGLDDSELPLGFYECPGPTYNRQLTPKVCKWAAESGRFVFLKETSASLEDKKAKIDAMKDSSFKFFDANSATFLESLNMGGSGYDGILANFLPELHTYVYQNYKTNPEKAQKVQNYLGTTVLHLGNKYTVNCKHFLQLSGVPINLYSRIVDWKEYSDQNRRCNEQFRANALDMNEQYPINK